MDDPNKDDQIITAAEITKLTMQSGLYRAKVNIVPAEDNDNSHCIISWRAENGVKDSLKVEYIDNNYDLEMKSHYGIIDVREDDIQGNLLIQAQNVNRFGSRSKVVSEEVYIYGPSYLMTLQNVTLSFSCESDIIFFEDLEGMVGNLISYEKNSGEFTSEVFTTENEFPLVDAKLGGTIRSKTRYLINSSDIDTLEAVEYNETVIPIPGINTEVGLKLFLETSLVEELYNDTSYTVVDGVLATEMAYLSQSTLPMKLFVLEVDLNVPNISIETSMPNDGYDFGMQTMTNQAFYSDREGHKVWAGMNGDFYNMSTGVPLSIVYRNGIAVKTTFQDNLCTYFAIMKSGKALVAGQDIYEDIRYDIKEAVGGRVWLLKNGSIVAPSTVLEPRTCIGVSKDSTKVYLMAIDGRNEGYSNGMTYEEMAECLKALGAENGINLDGGGSTTFFIRNSPDFTENRFEIRNRPSGGYERSVANGLLIVSYRDGVDDYYILDKDNHMKMEGSY